MIYGHLHRMKPIKFMKLMSSAKVSQLTPWYPRMPFRACLTRRITHEPDAEETRSESSITSASGDDVTLLPPHRTFSGLPLLFISAGKQIYYDCREFPFVENEFVFLPGSRQVSGLLNLS